MWLNRRRQLSTLLGIEGTSNTGVRTLVLVIKVASDHIEVCWVSVHRHQDHGCVAPNSQKREIRWHYARNETSPSLCRREMVISSVKGKKFPVVKWNPVQSSVIVCRDHNAMLKH